MLIPVFSDRFLQNAILYTVDSRFCSIYAKIVHFMHFVCTDSEGCYLSSFLVDVIMGFYRTTCRLQYNVHLTN